MSSSFQLQVPNTGRHISVRQYQDIPHKTHITNISNLMSQDNGIHLTNGFCLHNRLGNPRGASTECTLPRSRIWLLDGLANLIATSDIRCIFIYLFFFSAHTDGDYRLCGLSRVRSTSQWYHTGQRSEPVPHFVIDLSLQGGVR